MKKRKLLVIQKVIATYIVSIEEGLVTVAPDYSCRYHCVNRTIASSLQIIGNIHLKRHKPIDTGLFLEQLFIGKGWSVNKAD